MSAGLMIILFPARINPAEHPLEGVVRMINSTSLFQEKFPEIAMVGSAWSFLRHFAPNVGASVIRNGKASFMGFGRNSFAYPSMPLDLIKHGMADPRKALHNMLRLYKADKESQAGRMRNT